MGKQPISLEQFRSQKQDALEQQQKAPLHGILVWLHCPHCDIVEYTEILAPQGRTHNCGTVVLEKEVSIDLRAEMTVTQTNIKRIDQLLEELTSSRMKKLLSRSMEKTLETLKESEQVYADRLQKATSVPVLPYEIPVSEVADRLAVVEVNALGLLVSEFRYQPRERFMPPGT